MERERRIDRQGADQSTDASAEAGFDPRHAKIAALMRRATAYHQRHHQFVEEFNQLTGGSCAGPQGGVSYLSIRRWQQEHGVRVDGIVGPETIAKAREIGADNAKADGAAPENSAKGNGAAGDAQPEAQPNGGGKGEQRAAAPAKNQNRGLPPPAEDMNEEPASAGATDGKSPEAGPSAPAPAETAEVAAQTKDDNAKSTKVATPRKVPLAEAFVLLSPMLRDMPMLTDRQDAGDLLAAAAKIVFDRDETIKPDLLAQADVRDAFAFLQPANVSWQDHAYETIAAFKVLLTPVLRSLTAEQKPNATAVASSSAVQPAAGQTPTPESPANASSAPAPDTKGGAQSATKPTESATPAHEQPKDKEGDAAAGAELASTDTKSEQAPAAEKHPEEDSVRSALESIEVVTKTDKTLALNPARMFELVPWNTQEKAEAFRGVQAAARELRKAKADVEAAGDAKHKLAALHRFEAATQKLDGATTGLKKYVLSQIPRILREQAHRENEADKKVAQLKHDKHAKPEQVAAAQAHADELHSAHKSKDQVAAQIEATDFGMVETERHRYDVTIDGEHVSLADHIEAYATTIESGLDGKAAGEKRDAGGGTVADVLEQSKSSESVKKILKTISTSEGGFSTVNTYDKAVVTWGMMQWTGGKGGDLETALKIIKRVAPDAFAARFQKYGIDVVGDELVVKDAGGGEQRGEAAAKAVQSSPALTGTMARAGMDSKIQTAELEASVETKIDAPLRHEVAVEHDGKHAKVRLGDIFTSEYGVGVLADATVHGGLPSAAIAKALKEFIAKRKLNPEDVSSWAAEAEKVLIPVVVAGWSKRAAELEKNGCSRDAGSFVR